MEIIPAILTDKSDEIIEKLSQLEGLHLTPQIDFMDGKFVPSTSLIPEHLPLSLKQKSWEAHLMVSDPVAWSARLYGYGCRRIYWHVETMWQTSLPLSSSRVEHGIALRLETSIDAIEPHAERTENILLMGIAKPGYQGEKFDERVYDKIAAVHKRYPRKLITVDGGVKLEHMKPLANLGVSRVVVGSAFWQYGDVKATLASFLQATL